MASHSIEEVVGRPRRTRRPTEDIFEDLMEAHMNTKYGSEGSGDAPLTLENFGARTRLHWSETKVTAEVEKLIGGFTPAQERALIALHNRGHAAFETISFMEEFNGNGDPKLFPKKDRRQISAKLLDMLGDSRGKPCRSETRQLNASTTSTSSGRDIITALQPIKAPTPPTPSTSITARAPCLPQISLSAAVQPRVHPSNGKNSGEVSTGALEVSRAWLEVSIRSSPQEESTVSPIQKPQSSISAKPGMGRTSHVIPSNVDEMAPASNAANGTGLAMHRRWAVPPPLSAVSATAFVRRVCAGLATQPASAGAYAGSARSSASSGASAAKQPGTRVMCAASSVAKPSSRIGFPAQPGSASACDSSGVSSAMGATVRPVSPPRRGRPKGRKSAQSPSMCHKSKKKKKTKASPATPRAPLGMTSKSALPNAPRRGRPPKALANVNRVSASGDSSRRTTKGSPASVSPVTVLHTTITPSGVNIFRKLGRQRTAPTYSRASITPHAAGTPATHTTRPAVFRPVQTGLCIAPPVPLIINTTAKPPPPQFPSTLEAWKIYVGTSKSDEELPLSALDDLDTSWIPKEIANPPPPVRAGTEAPTPRWIFPDEPMKGGSARFAAPTFEEQQAAFDEQFFPDPACDEDASWIPSSLASPFDPAETLSDLGDIGDFSWLSAFDDEG